MRKHSYGCTHSVSYYCTWISNEVKLLSHWSVTNLHWNEHLCLPFVNVLWANVRLFKTHHSCFSPWTTSGLHPLLYRLGSRKRRNNVLQQLHNTQRAHSSECIGNGRHPNKWNIEITTTKKSTFNVLGCIWKVKCSCNHQHFNVAASGSFT